MPPQAEARAWWADVQHLRPDADGFHSAPPAAPIEAPVFDESSDELAQRRRGRITGRVLEDSGEAHLRRADAASFADALSLDGDEHADAEHDEDDRRTVHITGRPEPLPVRRLYEVQPRRARETTLDRLGARPDRVAMWAVALGIFLVLLAAVSSSADAATLVIH